MLNLLDRYPDTDICSSGLNISRAVEKITITSYQYIYKKCFTCLEY